MPFTNPNFTPILDSVDDIAHVNSSYIVSQNSVFATTEHIFILMVLMGVSLLLISALTKSESCNDLSGIMACPLLLVSAIQAFSVDTLGGYGAAMLCEQTNSAGRCIVKEIIMLENHTMYHYDFLGVILAIFFLLSLANLYRLWLDHKKVTDDTSVFSNSAADTNPSASREGRSQGSAQPRGTGKQDME